MIRLGTEQVVKADKIELAKIEITEALKELHNAEPLSLGFSRAELFRGLKSAREAIVSYIESTGSIDATACKEILDTTRKYAIPIMEYWDRQGVTKRTGNSRVLRR